MNKKITILIPAYNEQASLPLLFKRLQQLAAKESNHEFEFLFVNDGSADDTLRLVADAAKVDKRINYLNLSRNFGKEVAMIAGLDHARGDAVVIIDADLQDPPELIPDMIRFWEDGYDDVYAKRRSRNGETWLKKKTSQLYYRILQRSTTIAIQ